ncbi:LysR family transcriptional regulator [Ochrobactrum chromiisoli]|uniref:LysR family transcriptional regulator n=1 Tax=Ochrobactrum chromiisoli TaxID=2993941 RepID=A0ABT3QSG7_9HYPH|nr:LysR family transcriptional regulator [Ochrobactrum chromiisoli]MCX2698571.1 LysR family transcriptional regulator [Ochrobactrum chromiisoli]
MDLRDVQKILTEVVQFTARWLLIRPEKGIPVSKGSFISLDLPILLTFVETVKHQSFTKAAAELGLALSTVSFQIRKLEERVGVTLLDRTPSHVRVTAEGTVMYRYALEMLDVAEEATRRIISRRVSGIVKLGAPLDFGAKLLPEFLVKAGNENEQVSVEAVIDTGSNLLRLFESGQLDVVVLNCAVGASESHGLLLKTPKLIWAAAKNGQAPERRPLPLAVLNEDCIWRKATIGQLEAVSRPYRIALEGVGSSAVYAAVAADVAVTAVPAWCISAGMGLLAPNDGFDELPEYEIRMCVRNEHRGEVAFVVRTLKHFITSL